LAEAKEPLTPKEIMVATGRSNRNPVDQDQAGAQFLWNFYIRRR
jgi:hypothetical protein